MKMIRIIRSTFPLLVLFLGVMTSCEQEPAAGGLLSSKKAFSFIIENGSGTRTRSLSSPAPSASDTLLCALPIGDASEGRALYLNVSESSLDDEWQLTAEAVGETSVTRGTPVFTENLGNFAASTYAPLASSGTYTSVWQGMANAVFERGTGDKANVWSHYYGNGEQWPDNDGALVFFMRYPVSATSGISGLSYERRDGKNVIILDDYATPGAGSTTAAEAQTDIVFATATLKESNSQSANRILFYHPLCGVKFKIGTLPDNLVIKSVTLAGVYAQGDCVVTPYYDNTAAYDKTNSNKDGDNATKSAACVAWSNLATSGTFSQAFTSVDYDTTPSADLFPSGFTSEGTTTKPNQDQLNTSTLSKTFNLIPQTFTDSRKLTLTVTFAYDGIEQTSTTHLAGIEWKAGSLYTYTISFTDNIDVTVTDVVNGNVKSNIVITNTGNVPEYLRATIVGCWCDDDDNIVAGWTPSDGTFTALGGSGKWYQNETDGYYYYKDPVPAGDPTPTALFGTYTAPDAPEEGAHLEITITAQAVVADKAVANKAWGIDQSIYTQQNQ